jgi:starvation-inducible DNA-binding protein
MEELIEKMKVALASTYAFGLKAQNFHWNVEGPNFVQYHEFFETLYEDATGAVDKLAEEIRALNAYAPASFTRFQQLTVVQDEIAIPNAMSMFAKLNEDNDKLIATLTETFQAAEAAKVVGLANFLQDRIDIHSKHGWMLRATMKV